MVSPFRALRFASSPAPPLTDERDVEPFHIQRPARRRQIAPEPAQQVVVAPAAAQRHAERAVVDLEDRAGVVAERARQPEVEDHALGRARRQPLLEGAQAADDLGGRALEPVEHLGPAAQLRCAQERLRGLLPQPQRSNLTLQADEVARDELLQDRRPRSVGHAHGVQQRRVQRRVAEPDLVAVEPDRVEHLAQQLDRLDRPLRPGRADELDPRLEHLARLATRRPHGAVGVGEVAEAQRRIRARVAGRHHARDRDRHVRAQHEHVALLVEQPVGGLGRRGVAARQRRLVLQRRRRHLAVAASVEHRAHASR